MVWILGSWIIAKCREYLALGSDHTFSFFFLISLQAQEGSSVSFFRCYKTKLFGMPLSLKILASGTASDQMPAFVCFWKGICLPIRNLLKEHWTQLSSLFMCSNVPLKRCSCRQFKADRI